MINWLELREQMKSDPRLGFYPCTAELEVGQVLGTLCRLLEAKLVVELGMWRGGTALSLMEGMGEKGMYIGVDIEDNRAPCMKVPPLSDLHQFIKGRSVEVLDLLPGNIDLAFIDSDHCYDCAIRELTGLRDKMKPHGIVALHDPIFVPGVQQAIDEVKGKNWYQGFTIPTISNPERNCPHNCGLALLQPI